jgi:hypothetical protein
MARIRLKGQPVVVVLTIVNAAMLTVSLIQPHRTAAQDIAPVIRTHSLQVVDDHGRVRAEIRVFPPDPKVKMPDGTTGYPETVLLRMVTSKGRPTVKIAAVEDGSVISLGGDSDPTDIQLLARGPNPSVKLVDKEGKQQVVKP